MAEELTVCLLTRNEERNLDRVLRSVQGIAGEVVVAESGSTDRTVAIAEGYGARVIPFQWNDDFGEGRNIALDHAKGDWILWLNPDEELPSHSQERIDDLIQSAGDAFGFIALIRRFNQAEQPERLASRSIDLRLFRRDPAIRYRGRLHPTLGPAEGEPTQGQGGRVVHSNLEIYQHAYMSRLDDGKLRWAIRIIEKELQDHPGHLPTLVEYGRNLLLLEDSRGHDVMADAIDRIAPDLNAPRPPDPAVAPLLEYLLTVDVEQYRGSVSINQAAEIALRWFSKTPPILWALAHYYAKQQRPEASVPLLEQLLRLGISGNYDVTFPFDPSILGPRATELLNTLKRSTNRTGQSS